MLSNHLSRRKFLTSIGLLGGFSAYYFNPRKQLLSSIACSLINDCKSKYLSNNLKSQPARNFVQFNLYGAPTRWAFDHVLRPSSSDSFVQARGVYNFIQNIDLISPHMSQGIYADELINGFNMPHLWRTSVAGIDEKIRPMSELMSNMLIIRGCRLDTDAHPQNNGFLVAPVAGGVSLTGLVADHSSLAIPAISVGRTPAVRAYSSLLKTSTINIPSEDPDYVSYLLKIFNKEKNNFRSDKEIVDKEIEDALNVLKAYSASNNPGSEILYNERHKAEQLMRKSVHNLQDVFLPLASKYENLFQRTINHSSIAGVNDKEIPGIKFPCEVKGNLDLLEALGSHHHENGIICDSDLRKMFLGIRAENLSKNFALAEFALTEGLSSSIVLATPQERGCTLLGLNQSSIYGLDQIEKNYSSSNDKTIFKIKNGMTSRPRVENLLNDSHGVGWITNIVGCNLFYQGLSSCLLEFIDRLKATSINSGNLFDETVIQIASEFDRKPSNKGAGYDHNREAQVTTLFSGIIKKPTILGNILVGRESKNNESIGTMGNAAQIPSLSNKIININNISSTLSTMLRIPLIVSRADSLVEVSGSNLTPLIENARNVEDEIS